MKIRGSRVRNMSGWVIAAACVAGAFTWPTPAGAQSNGVRHVWVDGTAGRLRATDGGRGGLPVVFVHSLAGNRTQWNEQIEHLRGTRRVIAFDLRGHGESDKPADADYSVAGVAEDIGAVVDHFELGRFVLVAHSFGGGVAAAYAGAHPNRVRGLLFADPIGDQRSTSAQIEVLVRLFESPSFEQSAQLYYEAILINAAPDVRVQVLEALRQTSRQAIIGAFRSMMEFDPVATLGPYPGPMLSVISDLNNFSFSLHNIVPDLPSELITGTSHWLQMDKPAEFNARLDRFLAGVR